MKNLWSIAIDHETGLPIANCNVYVYIYGGIVLATIYSDDGVTPEDNPFETDAYGRFNFYVESGIYYLKFSKDGYDTWTSNPITIPDEVDETGNETTKNKYVSNKIIKDLQTGVVLDAAALTAQKRLMIGQDNIVNLTKEIKWLLQEREYRIFAKKFLVGFDNIQCQLPNELITKMIVGEPFVYEKVIIKGNDGKHIHGLVSTKSDFKL